MARCSFILKTLRFALVFWVFACRIAETSQAAQDAKDVLLAMTRKGQPPVRLTAAEFDKLARRQVKATDHQQKLATSKVSFSAMFCSLLPCRSERS